MIKVTELNVIEEMVNEIDFERKITKDIKKDQIKHLTAQGIDKKIAQAMVNAFQSVGLA